MTVLQLYKITKAYGDQTVLRDISLSINEGDRMAIIGSNGSGKTTLLRCITGQIEPDAGRVIKKANMTIGHLEQISEQPSAMLVWEAVMLSFAEILQIRQQMGAMEKQMAFLKGEKLQVLVDDYARKVETYELAEGYECESRAKKVLLGLGFDEEGFYKPLSSLSGGEKTRLHLARLLAQNPEMLLLDEPTNHLDMPAVEWLEDYLANYIGTVVVVSHDRRFLDKAADHVAEIRGGQLECFTGNYSAFIAKREALDLASQRAYDKQQEKIEAAEAFIRRYMAGVKSKQARGRQAQLNRLERLKAPEQSPVLGNKTIQIKRESGQDVIKLAAVSKLYGDKIILQQLDLQIRKGEKIALIGANGTGKTTLIKIITGEINADEGTIHRGSQVEIGYFSQEHENLGQEGTVLEEITDNFPLTLEEARTVLGRMLFRGDDVFKKIGDLSGGEQGRLALLKLILAGDNFLVLDEPTNHLDLDSRQVIADMLRDYPGTILFVSHDRHFIDYFADQVWVLEQGRIMRYQGNYSYYMEKKLIQQKEKMQQEPTRRKNTSSDQQFRLQQKEREKNRRQLMRAIADWEERITVLEKEKLNLETLLSEFATYQDDKLSRELPQKYQEVLQRLEESFVKWEELNHMLAESVEEGTIN
jgi:ATP-binding cassette subfamily F protein 3